MPWNAWQPRRSRQVRVYCFREARKPAETLTTVPTVKLGDSNLEGETSRTTTDGTRNRTPLPIWRLTARLLSRHWIKLIFTVRRNSLLRSGRSEAAFCRIATWVNLHRPKKCSTRPVCTCAPDQRHVLVTGSYHKNACVRWTRLPVKAALMAPARKQISATLPSVPCCKLP